MLVIVTYDVATETAPGRRRLRRVAKMCLKWGQRVQKSVFECQVDAMQFETLERELVELIEPKEDNLRLYRISDGARAHVREYGCFKAVDYVNDPLIL
jgi:CRISPR-associated protein Cas2